MAINIVKKGSDIDYSEVNRIATELNINNKLVELLFSRGLCDIDQIHKFLYPNKDNFYDPFLMKGMRETVDRLKLAIENNEKVVIYGDYDADGVCAAAILALYLSSQGLDVYAHIPNRVGEGYGLNEESLGTIIEKVLPDLIITCDCGISCYNEVNFVLDLGVDIIVTDHHEIGDRIPECVVVNPKQEDCSYPYNMLCGAGVALKIVHAMGGESVMEDYLDLACVATIADLVPLLDENRLIVQLGLKQLAKGRNIGLRELFANLDIKTPTSSEIAYKIAPRINAAGRVGDAFRAFRLLTEKSVETVREIINEINLDNVKRKELCDEMYEEAVGDLAMEDMVNSKAILLSHPAWEKGITGIVAARLTNDYNRPTFIMVNSGDGTYKGTCRSIDGINVYELLSNCSDCLIEFGGHNQAAGFSIYEKNIPAFKERVNAYLKNIDESIYIPTVKYDLDLEESDITMGLVRAFEMIEPVGNNNNRPLIRLKQKSLTVAPCKNNSNHISITTKSGFQMFAFNFSKQSYQLLSDGEKELVFELQSTSYSAKTPKGVLKVCRPENLYFNKQYLPAYRYELLSYKNKSEAKYTVIHGSKLPEILDNSVFGTLVVADNEDDYRLFVSKYNIGFFEYIYSSNKNNYSKIMIAPDFRDDSLSLSLYQKIIFLKKPFSDSVISYINSKTNAQVFVLGGKNNADNVSLERGVFAEYYECIRRIDGVEFTNFFTCFKKIKSIMSDINVQQFAVCVAIFEEMGILEVSRSPYKLKIIPSVKVDLTQSKICKLLS